MFPAALTQLAETVLSCARKQGLKLATAESCTGGLIAACLTDVPGSSDVVDRGFIVYSDGAKQELLGVSAEMLARYGAVSEEVARAMVTGAIEHARASLAVSCTGIAGPSGGSALKPVGLVHIAAGVTGKPMLHEEKRFGDIGRGAVRMKTVEAALELLRRVL